MSQPPRMPVPAWERAAKGAGERAPPKEAPAAREDTAGVEEDRPLRCASCGAIITRESQRISVDGSHEHTRLNPHAVAFHFGCFQDAEGAAVLGAATTEASWFSGFTWQYALCRSCGVHLGWFFSGPGAFFGLVLNRLVSGGA